MAKITVIGLGIIGSIWARHYRADGHEVVVWNRSPRPEVPGFEPDLKVAVARAELVHLCVADPAAVEAVLAVALPAMPKGTLVIQSSTISPEAAECFAAQVGAVGDYLEAPFTGSKPAAEARELVFFMGGPASVVARAAPYLESISRRQFHIGSPAQAAAIKLAMNLQIASISQALSEGWHLARRHGLSHETFYEVLRENVAHSGLCELKAPKLASGDYSPQFSVKHMGKDLRLALEAAAEGLDLPQTRLNRQIYQAGIKAGLGDLDFIALEQRIPRVDPS